MKPVSGGFLIDLRRLPGILQIMLNQNYHKFPSLSFRNIHPHIPEAGAIYIANSIKTFAESLVGVFIPIFILKLPNLPLINSNDLINRILWVLIFYFFRSIFILLLLKPLTNIIFGRINLKWSIFISNVVLAFSLLCLSIADKSTHMLILASFLVAAAIIMYWLPFHLFFIRKLGTKDGHYGKRYGFQILFDSTSAAIAPLTGGIILTLFGFQALFATGIIVILISAIPIVSSVTEHAHGKHNAYYTLLSFIKDPKYKNDSIAMASIASDSILYAVFWPIMLIIVLESFEKVGAITSISIAISSLVAIMVGIQIDKGRSKILHKIGVAVNSMLFIIRAFVFTPISVYLIDIFDRMNGAFYVVPFTSAMYKHAREGHHDSDFIIYREYVVHGIMAVTTLAAFILLFFIPRWQYIFILTAIVSPFVYWVQKKR